MSTYRQITRHPEHKVYMMATWHDDYFMPHVYGVQFDGEDKVYPVEYIKPAQLKHFWAQDVIDACYSFFAEDMDKGPNDALVLEFLKEVDNAYKERWEDDPLFGGGATVPEGE